MKHVSAVLWRNYNQATFDTLSGVSKGQYDIRLGSKYDFNIFFDGECHENITSLGGYDINVEFEPYLKPGDPGYVEKKNVLIRYMGASSARKDWNIPSQRPTTAYPLWIEPGRFPKKKDEDSYVIVVRTTDDKYYGRCLLSSEVINLPKILKDKITKSETGLLVLDNAVRTSEESEKVYYELMDNKNLLMYGPPGTGKTSMMQDVVSIFKNGGPGEILFDEDKNADYFSEKKNNTTSAVEWTTFHQSYSYEEFIIGMTSKASSTSLLDIQPRQGKLIELCEFARVKGNRALIVIDELNRANVSKVFGEFITVVEPDKRLLEDGSRGPKTVELSLPYLDYGQKLKFTNKYGTFELENPFTMPFYVYTLASMNSVDKSIFPLDSALKRRFFRHDIYFDANEIEKHFEVVGKTYVPSGASDISAYDVTMLKILAKDLIKEINEKIKMFIGKDYTLGGSYIWNLKEITDPREFVDSFRRSIFEQIYPQLEEMFRNNEEQLLYIMGCNDSEASPCTVVEPNDDEYELGAVKSIVFEKEKLTDIQFISWLERVAE